MGFEMQVVHEALTIADLVCMGFEMQAVREALTIAHGAHDDETQEPLHWSHLMLL